MYTDQATIRATVRDIVMDEIDDGELVDDVPLSFQGAESIDLFYAGYRINNAIPELDTHGASSFDINKQDVETITVDWIVDYITRIINDRRNSGESVGNHPVPVPK